MAGVLTRCERVESKSCSSTVILRVPVDERIRRVSIVAMLAVGSSSDFVKSIPQ
jgi:hypothetical protein